MAGLLFPYTLLLNLGWSQFLLGFVLAEVGFTDYSVGCGQIGRDTCLFFSIAYSFHEPVWCHVAKSRTKCSFLDNVLVGSSKRYRGLFVYVCDLCAGHYRIFTNNCISGAVDHVQIWVSTSVIFSLLYWPPTKIFLLHMHFFCTFWS